MKGTLHHFCIQTDCYEQSKEFYCKLFDMEILDETANFHGRDYNTWLKNDYFMIELQTAKKDKTFDKIDQNHTGIAHLCFWVENLEKQLEEIINKNVGKFEMHDDQVIYQVNQGKLFKMTAPEGTMIEFRDSMTI